VAVRKTVTVLFCDLVGSTALGDQGDPEVVQERMAAYHAELRAILERHGGTVEKFVGDAVMAVFGIPEVHEDDALRAVRAAAEIRDRVEQLQLEVRTGLNTGEVIAGEGETLVTGDAVNVAARLEQAAEPGEILLGEGTARLVRGTARAERVEPLALKGKSELVPALRLLELVADVPAFTRPIEAPFVGRERELGTLEQALQTAVEQRAPQLVTVVGPPGIGKSRLIREFVQPAQASVLVGRCLSYGEGITYWPLQEVVRQLGDVDLEDELARVRISAALGEGSASPEEIAWGFRKLFEALAQKGPLVVVLDDIHWAEPTLLDLIEYVAAFATDAPLLLLCSARSDLFEHRAAWATPKPNAGLVTLDPLPVGETETLIEELGDLPEEAKERIVEAAEGNPLFVEQLVAHQAESGNGKLDIPPTIQALLAARIDRLEPPERAVIERASVEGRLFHRGAVQELVPEEVRPAVGSHLMTLVRKEFVRPDRAQLPGDDGFRFGHILIRDAAYDSIPKRLRAELHTRYADWLEEQMGDEAPDEILGYHLEQAYRYGAELGRKDDEVGLRAAERLAAAGSAARARLDTRAAVRLRERAVELTPKSSALHRKLLVDLAEELLPAGDLPRALLVATEARELARSTGDEHEEWRARIISALIEAAQEEGGADRAIEEGQAAVETLRDSGEHELLANAWYLLSEAYFFYGRFEEQLDALEQASASARKAGDTAFELDILAARVGPLTLGPRPVEEGFRLVDDTFARYGRRPEIQTLVDHLLLHLLAMVGRFDEVWEVEKRWRGLMRELGRDLGLGASSNCVWEACWLAKDWDRAEGALREGYKILERKGEKGYLSSVAANLGDTLYEKGRLDDAYEHSVTAERVGAEDDPATQMAWRTVRAKVLATRGETAQAEELAREAEEIAASTEFLNLRAWVLLGLADVLNMAGKEDEATDAVERALGMYERKGNLVGAERARALLA
jgi:class 3 adenylate cyclase/tetratricopeptide (TPR) repeat protein